MVYVPNVKTKQEAMEAIDFRKREIEALAELLPSLASKKYFIIIPCVDDEIVEKVHVRGHKPASFSEDIRINLYDSLEECKVKEQVYPQDRWGRTFMSVDDKGVIRVEEFE